MTTKIFMYHCDPRVNMAAEATIARINLHALFYPKSVIQDNFLISEYFQKIINVDDSLSELIRQGILTLAFREGFSGSLVELMRELREQIKSGELRGFEDERSLELYSSPGFEAYLRNLDLSIKPETNNFVRWSPDLLGENYKRLMKHAAEENLSGLDTRDIAEDVFEQVDKVARNNGFVNKHKRTFYYDYAATLSDAEQAKKIKRWANNQYLRNLPNYYSLKVSLPQKAIRENGLADPFALVEGMNSAYKQQIEKDIEGIIFNERFLRQLKPDSILGFRESDYFTKYADDLNNGKDYSKSLSNYLGYIGQESPKHYGPWHTQIKEHERRRKIKMKAIIIGEIVLNIIITPRNFMLGTILNLALSQVVKQAEEKKKIEFSKIDLLNELVDFSHGNTEDTDNAL